MTIQLYLAGEALRVINNDEWVQGLATGCVTRTSELTNAPNCQFNGNLSGPIRHYLARAINDMRPEIVARMKLIAQEDLKKGVEESL